MVHSAEDGSLHGGACAIVAVLLLAGCAGPYDDWPLRPAGYAGDTQFWEEASSGCLYASSAKGRFEPMPLLRPDGTQMGCRSNLNPKAQGEGNG